MLSLRSLRACQGLAAVEPSGLVLRGGPNERGRIHQALIFFGNETRGNDTSFSFFQRGCSPTRSLLDPLFNPLERPVILEGLQVPTAGVGG